MGSTNTSQLLLRAPAESRFPFVTVAFLCCFAITTLIFAYSGGSELLVCFPREPFQLYGVPTLLSLFTHENFAHLFGNSLFMLVAGSKVEARLGAAKCVQLFLLSGLAGIAGQAYLSPVATIGASGAISGLVTLLVVTQPRGGTAGTTSQSAHLWLWVALWFSFDFFSLWSHVQAQSGNVGHGAHLGGAFAGMVLGLLPYFQEGAVPRANLVKLRSPGI